MATMNILGDILPGRQDDPTNDEYNEDLIIHLVSEIDELLLKLGPLQAADVTWPPAEGHQLDFSDVPAHISVNRGVASLMKRLPINKNSFNGTVPNMTKVDFLDSTSLMQSRTFNMQNYDDVVLQC